MHYWRPRGEGGSVSFWPGGGEGGGGVLSACGPGGGGGCCRLCKGVRDKVVTCLKQWLIIVGSAAHSSSRIFLS